jgi:hypothetical protein
MHFVAFHVGFSGLSFAQKGLHLVSSRVVVRVHDVEVAEHSFLRHSDPDFGVTKHDEGAVVARGISVMFTKSEDHLVGKGDDQAVLLGGLTLLDEVLAEASKEMSIDRLENEDEVVVAVDVLVEVDAVERVELVEDSGATDSLVESFLQHFNQILLMFVFVEQRLAIEQVLDIYFRESIFETNVCDQFVVFLSFNQKSVIIFLELIFDIFKFNFGETLFIIQLLY